MDDRQRLKESYLENASLDKLEDQEVLEMLLLYCCPRKDTNALSHNMIREFMTLYNLFEATPSAIIARCGVTEHVAILISMISRITSRYLIGRWDRKKPLDGNKAAKQFAISLFAGKSVEHMYVICLNEQKRIIGEVLVSMGTVMETAAYPRMVAEIVLAKKAAYVILAHNHPGGTYKPSHADRLLTSNLVDMLRPTGITVLDHIIVCGWNAYSFSAHKILDLG